MSYTNNFYDFLIKTIKKIIKINHQKKKKKKNNKKNQKNEKDLNKKSNKNNKNKKAKKGKKEINRANKNYKINKNSKSKNKNDKKVSKITKSPKKDTKLTNIKEIKSPNKKNKNSNNKSPNKKSEINKNNKKIVQIFEELQKIVSEPTSEPVPEAKPDPNIQQNEKGKENKENKENKNNKENKENNKVVKQKYPKSKKKNKKIAKIIIDEELKKSTPIRNLKKQPKGILKKVPIPTNFSFNLNSPPPKSQIRSRSSDKKVTFSSEAKEKKYKTFSEIFQSPSKLKATPLKRKINSEKKSSHKKTNILLVEDGNENKNDFIGKKRNISFNDERIVKEYNPKTPVRDVKERMTRKSPLERKKKENN
jgi:hypothetical protein